MHVNHTNNLTKYDFTRKLMIFGCLLFTGFCFWKAVPGLTDRADASVVSTAEAALIPSVSYKRAVTTPIQDMRPGMRIVGRNPNRLETESTIDPTPEGWRLLSVRMLKADGSDFEAQLLRPLSWISRHRAKPGATIQLNMPELHVVGAAEVLSISDCPPIDPGDGPVVLSTFKNVSNNVLNIYVEGEEAPIGVTAGHPIWSEDRQAFIHSEKLQIGEKLRSALGRTVRITSIEPRAGPEAVYNLEVAGEHVYSVTDSGLLVHNTCPDVPELYQISGGTSAPRNVTRNFFGQGPSVTPPVSPGPLRIPQGFTEAEFTAFSQNMQTLVHELGLPPGELLAHGSRVKGFAQSGSDIDVILRTAPESFAIHVAESVVRKGGSRFSRGMLKQAIRQGRLDQFRAHPELGRKLHELVIPDAPVDSVDFSIVLPGSKFDNGPFISIGR